MNHITTHSGRQVPVDTPDLEHIDIADIAEHLSKLSRFNGATSQPYCVAHHSVLVAKHLAMTGADPGVQMLGLLHDAHEAFLGDITTPIRKNIAEWSGVDHIGRIADRFDQKIFRRFRVTPYINATSLGKVRSSDRAVFIAEWIKLMPGRCPEPGEPARVAFAPLFGDRAKDLFLKHFDKLEVEAGLTIPIVPTGIMK